LTPFCRRKYCIKPRDMCIIGQQIIQYNRVLYCTKLSHNLNPERHETSFLCKNIIGSMNLNPKHVCSAIAALSIVVPSLSFLVAPGSQISTRQPESWSVVKSDHLHRRSFFATNTKEYVGDHANEDADEWHPRDPAQTTPQLLKSIWDQIARASAMVKGVSLFPDLIRGIDFGSELDQDDTNNIISFACCCRKKKLSGIP
jgi:hypothetical protein